VTESQTPANDTANPAEANAPEAAPTPADVSDQAVDEELPEAPVPPASGVFWGTGRRKSAVARVRLIPGEGSVQINKRTVEAYFTEPQERLAVREPLMATKTEGAFKVFVNVRGGGHSGQAGAIRLGIARALVRANERYEPALREHGYLTRDARVVERKKYGQRKARRRFQFSKR
jgi:small subunit ribosomal protein S9